MIGKKLVTSKTSTSKWFEVNILENLNEIAARFGGKIPDFKVEKNRVFSDLTPTFDLKASGTASWMQSFRGGDQDTAGTSLRGNDEDAVFIAHKEIASMWRLKGFKPNEFIECYNSLAENPII